VKRATLAFRARRAIPDSRTQGEKGETGEKGSIGEKGDPGDRGERGEPGAIGEKGDRGEPGERGIDGERGVAGERGEKGDAGEPGIRGEKGDVGDPGPQGAIGPRGEKGIDGRDGRDALALDIASMIEVDKTYPRGSYASHLGGIWVARKNTKGMDGWECIVNGIANVDFDMIDERTAQMKCVRTDGEEIVKTVKMAVVLDRGVYKALSEYEVGDGVTWNGSFWIAKKVGVLGKPGERNDDWRLSIKRGRDGKDGLKGEKGDPGMKGRDGKDLTR
jgi:collagen type III alpha